MKSSQHARTGSIQRHFLHWWHCPFLKQVDRVFNQKYLFFFFLLITLLFSESQQCWLLMKLFFTFSVSGLYVALYWRSHVVSFGTQGLCIWLTRIPYWYKPECKNEIGTHVSCFIFLIGLLCLLKRASLGWLCTLIYLKPWDAILLRWYTPTGTYWFENEPTCRLSDIKRSTSGLVPHRNHQNGAVHMWVGCT